VGKGQGLETVGATHDTPIVSIQEVARSFGNVVALDGVSLDVARGEFVSMLGPSGCGKTTLLRIVGGFEVADRGRVLIEGRDMARVPPDRRPVNMVFQRYALFPHMSVGQNVGFGLALKRKPRSEIAAKVEAMLRLVRLEGFGDRTTTQLSGGQAQRVALARALANDPAVLLLDEPLAALDLKLRQAMHFELRRIQRAVGSTFVYVTHDQEEALTMSDRIVLMNHGSIEQIGTPFEVYRAPRTRFVSSFIGEANLFEGEAASSRPLDDGSWELEVETDGARLVVRHGVAIRPRQRVWVSVRPETMYLELAHPTTSGERNCVLGEVEGVVFLGSAIRYLIGRGNAPPLLVQTDATGKAALTTGERVLVRWSEEAGILLCD
jgi:spermidine/putrescine ABC transporter ATP-binding subunit